MPEEPPQPTVRFPPDVSRPPPPPRHSSVGAAAAAVAGAIASRWQRREGEKKGPFDNLSKRELRRKAAAAIEVEEVEEEAAYVSGGSQPKQMR